MCMLTWDFYNFFIIIQYKLSRYNGLSFPPPFDDVVNSIFLLI